MKNLLIVVAGIGLFAGGVLVASASKREPQPKSPSPAPAAKKAEASPAVAPAPPDDAARLREEVESLRRQIAELEGYKKAADAKKAEESDPATRGYSGMKLMDDKLREKLGLSVDQELKMREAILKYLKDSQAVWARKDLTFQQKEQEVERLKALLEPEFQAILTAAQYAEMSTARTEKKAKTRESGIASEAAGYRQFLGLDAEQGRQLEAIVRAFYDASPAVAPRYQWMKDRAVREQIAAILRTQEQIDRFQKNMAALDGARQ